MRLLALILLAVIQPSLLASVVTTVDCDFSRFINSDGVHTGYLELRFIVMDDGSALLADNNDTQDVQMIAEVNATTFIENSKYRKSITTISNSLDAVYSFHTAPSFAGTISAQYYGNCKKHFSD